MNTKCQLYSLDPFPLPLEQVQSSALPPTDKQLSVLVAKQMSKNPLRKLPDFNGIEGLTGAEIKRDYKDIEIASGLGDGRDEDMDGLEVS